MLRCLLICDKTVHDAATGHHATMTTNAWVNLADAPSALLQAQADGQEVVGLLTQRQPRSGTGKRVMAVGAVRPVQKGA